MSFARCRDGPSGRRCDLRPPLFYLEPSRPTWRISTTMRRINQHRILPKTSVSRQQTGSIDGPFNSGAAGLASSRQQSGRGELGLERILIYVSGFVPGRPFERVFAVSVRLKNSSLCYNPAVCWDASRWSKRRYSGSTRRDVCEPFWKDRTGKHLLLFWLLGSIFVGMNSIPPETHRHLTLFGSVDCALFFGSVKMPCNLLVWSGSQPENE